MKRLDIFLTATILLLVACKPGAQTMDNKNFKAEKVTKTAKITVRASIEKIFPLFGAFEERKWAYGWDPTLIYPEYEMIEEGTTFKTPGHGHYEHEFIWLVTKYDPKSFLIQYLVYSENRYWTITVKCSEDGKDKTTSKITYTFIGLNKLGNQLNKHALEKMYHNDLRDWEEAINYYLSNGKVKPKE